MAIVAPAVPAVSLAALLSVGLLALTVTIVLYGLYVGYDATMGELLRQIAGKVRGIRFVGGRVADAIESINDLVLDSIGNALLNSEKATAKLFHGLAWVWEETVNATVDLARSVADAFEGLREGEIPRQVHERTHIVVREVDKVDHRTRAREKAIAKQAATGIDRLNRDLAAEQLAREHGIDALEVKIQARLDGIAEHAEHAISGVRSWAGKRIGTLDSRLEIVTGLLGAGALTAAAVRALDLRFPFYKCRNVRDFNRLLCRSPIGALDDLFGLALLTVGSLSLVEFARELQGITDFTTGAINDWITED